MLSARTNRVIGGVAPSSYLEKIEDKAQISPAELDDLLKLHLIDPELLRADALDQFFISRREGLCNLVEKAIGKTVQRDISIGIAEEDSVHFEEEEI